MMSKSSEPRRLYLDINLVVQGFDKSFSVLGASTLHELLLVVVQNVFGDKNVLNIKNGFAEIVSGKILVNMSNVFTKS